MVSFARIYTGDYSAEGFHDGVLDGKNSRPKKAGFKYLRSVNFINHFWQRVHAYQTYVDSYHKGYDDGQRIREGVFKNLNNQSYDGIHLVSESSSSPSISNSSFFYSKEVNHMDMNYYEQHISAIQNAIDELKFIIGMFHQSLELYSRQVSNAEKEGLLRDYVDQLEKNYSNLYNQKEKLVGYLERLIKKLIECQDLLRNAQRISVDN